MYLAAQCSPKPVESKTAIPMTTFPSPNGGAGKLAIIAASGAMTPIVIAAAASVFSQFAVNLICSSSRLRGIATARAASTCPMVRMAGEDGQTAIELLQHEHPDELVRQRHGAEGQDELGPFAHRWIEAVGAADGESERRRAAIAPAPEMLGEAFARQRRAAFVERHKS